MYLLESGISSSRPAKFCKIARSGLLAGRARARVTKARSCLGRTRSHVAGSEIVEATWPSRSVAGTWPHDRKHGWAHLPIEFHLQAPGAFAQWNYPSSARTASAAKIVKVGGGTCWPDPVVLLGPASEGPLVERESITLTLRTSQHVWRTTRRGICPVFFSIFDASYILKFICFCANFNVFRELLGFCLKICRFFCQL